MYPIAAAEAAKVPLMSLKEYFIILFGKYRIYLFVLSLLRFYCAAGAPICKPLVVTHSAVVNNFKSRYIRGSIALAVLLPASLAAVKAKQKPGQLPFF